METLLVTATSTHRAQFVDTQDAAAVADGVPAFCVADGLGSFAYGGEAARFVTTEAACLLRGLRRAADLPRLFPELQRRLQAHAAPTVGAQSLDPRSAFGTTLLVGAEMRETLGIAYVGNGAIFHLPGDFTGFGEKMALPWTFSNLLRPHSVLKNGVEALTHYFDASGETEPVEPRTLWVRKETKVGDILLFCTDGIYSSDQTRFGRPGDGSVWQEVPGTIVLIHQALRAMFADPAPLTSARLQAGLQAALDGMRQRGELEDDATLGLLVTAEAVRYHAHGAHSHDTEILVEEKARPGAH